jgi:hypothetical protein
VHRPVEVLLQDRLPDKTVMAQKTVKAGIACQTRQPGPYKTVKAEIACQTRQSRPYKTVTAGIACQTTQSRPHKTVTPEILADRGHRPVEVLLQDRLPDKTVRAT